MFVAIAYCFEASFRELLSKSIAADDVEESGGSEDEEPIKITARKEKFEDFYEDIEEIGKWVIFTSLLYINMLS